MSGYISNVPLSNQSLGQTQPTINTNFTVLNTNMGTDHVDFTNAAPSSGGNGGRHNKVSLVQQGANPNLTGPLASLYTKAAPTTANTSDLYYQNGSLSANVTQLTGGGVTVAAWCQFNGTTPGTNPPTQGYNVSSVQRVSAGNYIINFTRNFTTTTYGCFVYPSGLSPGSISSRTVSSVSIFARSGLTIESTDINVMIFGTLT